MNSLAEMLRRDENRSLSYTWQRARRHVRWARSEGISRLVEEDRLDPVKRLDQAVRRLAWRRRHGRVPGTAQAVFVVGLQRSGTNMLVNALRALPEFETYNENNRRVFYRYALRSDQVVARVVAKSRHDYVLFKPLCDSHRVDQLMDALPPTARARAIWVYRDPEARARSAVSKFGDANLRALRAIVAGTGDDLWQRQRLSADTLDHLRTFEYGAMTPETAAVLFWFARNRLLFELGLHRRSDVLVWSYDGALSDPETAARRLCAFLELPAVPGLLSGVVPRSVVARPALRVDPRARALCDRLLLDLDELVR